MEVAERESKNWGCPRENLGLWKGKTGSDEGKTLAYTVSEGGFCAASRREAS
jgi:hypothetical protein